MPIFFFIGTIPLCTSPNQGVSYVPVDTVSDIVRDLVTYSAKAIGVPEVAATLSNEQCLNCCGFTSAPSSPPSASPSELSFHDSHLPLSPVEDALPGSSSHLKTKRLKQQNSKISGRVNKASRLSNNRNRHPLDLHRSNRRRSSSRRSSPTESTQQDKYNEVTRMKMSLLRAMLSSK